MWSMKELNEATHGFTSNHNQRKFFKGDLPMCVIMLASKVKPTEEMINRAYYQNDHGGGLAWRDKAKGVVRWKKGLSLEEMQELIKGLEPPFVAHFRIASSGGKSPQLCHPFPVEKQVDLALEGETKGYVLFHNGHWGEWKSFSKETALKMGRPLPIGHWSDTRAMAWACFNYGPGILEMIDEKCVIFGPKDLEVVRGTGWDEVNGVWCSNKHWEFPTGYRSHDHRRTGGDAFTPPFSQRSDPHSKDDYYKTSQQKATSTVKGTEIAGSGGNLAEVPFDLIEQMWEDQKNKPRSEWKLSKKQFKRLKKTHLQKLNKATRGRGKKPQQKLLPAVQGVH